MRPKVLLLLLLGCEAPLPAPGRVVLPPPPPPPDLACEPTAGTDVDNCLCRGRACPTIVRFGLAARSCCPGTGCGHPLVGDAACGPRCLDCRPASKVCDRGACVLPRDACQVPVSDEGSCPPGFHFDAGCCVQP